VSIGLIQVVCVVLLINSAGTQARMDVAQPMRPANSITVTPQKIDFGSQAVGTSSQPKAAILTNISNASVTISDISASGIDFTESNDCPTSLAPGSNCKIEVTFTPAITGLRLGTIIVSGSNPASPRFLVLSGTGE
jgi:hypothetical protein